MVTIVEKLQDAKKECIGCTACINSCPKDAITAMEDDRGFVKATIDKELCIDCSKCLDVCPLIVNNCTNYKDPKCYAAISDDDYLRKSSSGGIFLPLAEVILKMNGYVCGPIFDHNMELSYTITNDMATVEKMSGSKYIFSKMDNVIRQIKTKIAEGFPVLFVGCPCQVAAVKNCISSDYLYTVDLLCGGLPSYGIYRKYLRSLERQEDIIDLKFRDKRFPYGTMVVKYDDGTESARFNDLYFKSFLKDIVKMNNCFNCSFSSFPRQGDLTIGDYWHINMIVKEIDASDGVSAVLVNNNKGQKILDLIGDRISYIRETPLSFLKTHNRTSPIKKKPLSYERLFDMVCRGVEVSKAMNYAIGWKYDIGITGFWRVYNFGGELSYYALFKFLEDCNKECIFIEARHDFKGAPAAPHLLSEEYKYYSIAPWYKTIEEERELNKRVSTFIVGSDQVWNRNFIGQDSLEAYSLDFVSEWNDKISISSSFGTNKFEGTKDELGRFVNLLKRFKGVSVREVSGQIMCEAWGIKSSVVMDPVFYCSLSHYKALAAKSTVAVPHRYVFNYVIHPHHFNDSWKLYEKLGFGPISVIKDVLDICSKNYGMPLTKIYTAHDWVRYLICSDYIVTDSFHALTFALRFEKQFIIIYNIEDGVDRLKTLLDLLDLSERLVSNVDEAMERQLIEKQIDYSVVTPMLIELCKHSIDWVADLLDISEIDLKNAVDFDYDNVDKSM